MLDKAVCPRDINNVKHEVDKIYKENEKEFVKGRLEQQEKLSHLKNRVKRSQPQNTERVMREELETLREQWLNKMTSKGDPPQPPPNVHIYGDVVLDKDELACASLGPKWLLFPELKENSMRH